MKYILIAAVVAALCWIGISRFNRSSQPLTNTADSPVSSSRVAQVALAPPPAPPLIVPKPSIPPPAPVAETARARVAVAKVPMPSAPAWPAVPWPTTQSPVIEPTKPSGPPAPLPQIVLADVLGPNNLYHDDAFGISAIYPQGWTIPGARRWGTNNSENTVSLVPDAPTTARPSMYYQMYPNGYPEIEGPEAYFRRVAQNKENQRVAGGVTDYKNVPESFEFTEINGNPALSYFGVFNRGNEVQTELFVRVLGKKGYVMFFVPGRMEDVRAIMPQIKQMAATVKVP